MVKLIPVAISDNMFINKVILVQVTAIPDLLRVIFDCFNQSRELGVWLRSQAQKHQVDVEMIETAPAGTRKPVPVKPTRGAASLYT